MAGGSGGLPACGATSTPNAGSVEATRIKPLVGRTADDGRRLHVDVTAPAPLASDDVRLTRPLLTLRETAWSLHIPESTLRTWTRGYRRTGVRPASMAPIVTEIP